MNVADALAEVELAIVEERLGDATRILGAVAQRLLETPDPLELAHASWLAGAVALREGDERNFVSLSRHAVESLRLAGEDVLVRGAIASRAELLEQLGDVQEVQERGAAGLMNVLDRQCARLVDIAAAGGWHDPRWPLVNRQRALLPALLALVEASTGAPAPIASVIDELELDAVESALLAVLAPLTHAGRPLRPNQLARTCFGDSRSHDDALLRLRDDSRLARGRALVPTPRGELALAPSLMTRLYPRSP
ncbi:MAG TPA: hypothetical protein VM261_04775 [Kofleriaceae bacterium]|nr:hypothetical protein [Kofleriaceae bacterium]